MKRIILFLLVALCLSACEQKEKAAMSVANKTFYNQNTQQVYFKFTTDSVYNIMYQSVNYKGTYIQEDDIVKMKVENIAGYQYAFVKKDMLIVSGIFYTLERPND